MRRATPSVAKAENKAPAANGAAGPWMCHNQPASGLAISSTTAEAR